MEGMPLINLTLEHGRTLKEARRHLETAVHQVSAQFGSVVRRVEWEADRSRVKLEGIGFWLEMSVDAQVVHATGDVPVLGGLLGSSLASALKQIMQQTFRNKLP
jgi:Putative polyhydroxyalkanoic acid system protein (PHA_gran_rgn)